MPQEKRKKANVQHSKSNWWASGPTLPLFKFAGGHKLAAEHGYTDKRGGDRVLGPDPTGKEGKEVLGGKG